MKQKQLRTAVTHTSQSMLLDSSTLLREVGHVPSKREGDRQTDFLLATLELVELYFEEFELQADHR